MTTMLDTVSGWQVPVRQVGAAVPLATEQPAPAEPAPALEEQSPTAPSVASPDQHDQEPEPAGANNVIPMHPESETVPQSDDVEEEQDSVGVQPASTQHDPVDLDPAPEPPTDPAPNGFSLRHSSFVGYCMSVGIGAIGQILALAAIFGGTFVAWGAAVIAAAFAEVTMIGAGSWSLELRRKGHPWKLLLVGAGTVCAYAVGLQLLHYLPQGVGTAAVFAGASAIGWVLHMAVEHVRVAAYLKDQQRYETDLAAWRARQRQQPQRSASPSRPAKQPARKSSRARSTGTTHAKTSGASKQGKPKLTADVVAEEVRSGQLGEGDGPATLRRRLKDRYVIPADSTLKRWIAEARKSRAASA